MQWRVSSKTSCNVKFRYTVQVWKHVFLLEWWEANQLWELVIIRGAMMCIVIFAPQCKKKKGKPVKCVLLIYFFIIITLIQALCNASICIRSIVHMVLQTLCWKHHRTSSHLSDFALLYMKQTGPSIIVTAELLGVSCARVSRCYTKIVQWRHPASHSFTHESVFVEKRSELRMARKATIPSLVSRKECTACQTLRLQLQKAMLGLSSVSQEHTWLYGDYSGHRVTETGSLKTGKTSKSAVAHQWQGQNLAPATRIHGPTSLPTDRAGRSGVMGWGGFFLVTFWAINTNYHLNVTDSLSILVDHVHYFMAKIYPSFIS